MKVKILLLSLMVMFVPYGMMAYYLLPVFYNKNDQKFYGLFVHDTQKGWTPIEAKLNFSTIYPEMESKLKEVFGNLFDKLFKDVKFDEENIQSVTLRDNAVFMIPVFNFISEATLNQQLSGNQKIDGFVWLDLSKFEKNKAIVEKGTSSYDFSGVGGGFIYHFPMYLNYDSLPDSERPSKIMTAYKNKMEGLPVQNIPIETTSPLGPTKPQELKPIQPVGEPTVSYPTNVKPENKFFYDAYSNAINALKRDIEIAKRAGTINTTIFWGGTNHTALTYSLSKAKSVPQIIEILLQNGVDPNGADSSGMTPLMWTFIKNQDKRIVELLLEYGANANIEFNGRPLFESEYRDDVKELLREYAEGTKQPIYFIYLYEMLKQLRSLMMRLQKALA